MRLHAIATFAGASVVAMAMSCGETLPATADASDAAVDATLEATADAAVDADADVDAGCTSAPCNVEEVATAQPAAIAASGAAMVWLENARVFLLDPGKAPITLMTPPNGTTGFLAIDNVTVLMTEDTGIRRCPTTGGCNAADPSVPIYQLTDTGPIAAGGGEMFATERTGARRLVSCGIDLKCDVSPSVVAYLPDEPKELALTSSSALVGLADQTIRAYPRAGRPDAGTPQPPALVQLVDLRGLAGSGADVYWADGSGKAIGHCNVDTCAATKTNLATERPFPRAVAVSGDKLYWVETDDDAVVRCTLPACSDIAVIARVPRPRDLTVGDRVYISSDTEQKIYATPR